MERDLRALEKFLNDDSGASESEGFVDEDFINRLVRFGRAIAHQNAFSEGQTICLHRAAATEGGGEFLGGFRLLENSRLRGGDAVLLHEPLREGF